MRFLRRSLAVCLAILMMAPAVGAQEHVVSRAALAAAVQQRVQQDQADREAIVSLLQRTEVRDVAARAGLSVEKAEAAVAMLQGEDLRGIAGDAREAQKDLAGGSSVTLSTTMIIIILLLVILIIVAVK
jgi:hypothetical protein